MMDNNKKLIIISVLFILCLVSFYGVIKYYSNKDIEFKTVKKEENIGTIIENNTTLADKINTNEEILLGDIDSNCTKYECTRRGDPKWQCGSGGENYQSNNQACLMLHGLNCYTGCSQVRSCVTNTCTKCKDGYELKDGKCQMICKIEGTPRVGRRPASSVSIGTSYKIEVSVRFTKESSTNCSPSISTTNGNTNTNRYLDDYTFNVTPTTGCTSSEYTVSAGGMTITSGTVQVRSKWTPEQSIPCAPLPEGQVTSEIAADAKGKDIYYTSPDGEGNYCGRKRRGECCNGCTSTGGKEACYKNKNGELKWTSDTKFGTKTNKTKSECKNCYGNSKIYSLASKVAWLSEANNTYTEFISSVTSESACKKSSAPSSCVPVNTGDPKNTKTINVSTCEDNVNNTTTDGMSCSGTPYYTIKCTNQTKTKFDLGDDGITTTSNNILVGQGFKYGITVNVVRTCDGKFDVDTWKKAYNYVDGVIEKAKEEKKKASSSEKKQLESLIIENENKLKELKRMVTTYNNYDLNKESSITSKINLSYKVKGKEQTVTTEMITEVIQKGAGKYSNKSEVKLGVSGLSNPYNYSWTNESKPTIVKLIPPKKYMDNNGKIANSGIDAGNKIYVDYYTEPKTYPLNIKVNGIGGNIVIENNKCIIKVVDQEIIYRPIDISNPFISKDWIPGSNWINDLFDFKNVIHSDIWSK